jgi:hypothetical protein
MRNLLPDAPSRTKSCGTNMITDRGAILCIGGPYLIYYVSPTEEELFMVSFLSSDLSLSRDQESSILQKSPGQITGFQC